MEKSLIHSVNYPVRWGDMDAYGHVNNTVYFLYVQEARFKMLIDKNIPINPSGVAPVLAEASCKFIRPITFPETIKIDTFLVSAKGKKLIFEHELKSVTNEAITYAIMSSVIVFFDFKIGASCEIPDYVLELLGGKL